MEQFNRGIHFFKKFKMINDKIACFDKIFKKRFNFFIFLWIILIDLNSEISNSLKKYKISNSFFRDAHSNLRFCSWLFLAQHSQLRVTKVFITDIDISCFSLMLVKVFSVRIFLYDVNESYFLPISTKIFFRWCWLGLFSHWRQSWEIFANIG